jgi:hypothetical protein
MVETTKAVRLNYGLARVVMKHDLRRLRRHELANDAPGRIRENDQLDLETGGAERELPGGFCTADPEEILGHRVEDKVMPVRHR